MTKFVTVFAIFLTVLTSPCQGETYYDVLGINRAASQDKIKTAFKARVMLDHPDKTTGDAEKFRKDVEAYEVLKDPEKRAAYDRLGSNWAKAHSKDPYFDTSQSYGWNIAKANEERRQKTLSENQAYLDELKSVVLKTFGPISNREYTFRASDFSFFDHRTNLVSTFDFTSKEFLAPNGRVFDPQHGGRYYLRSISATWFVNERRWCRTDPKTNELRDVDPQTGLWADSKATVTTTSFLSKDFSYLMNPLLQSEKARVSESLPPIEKWRPEEFADFRARAELRMAALDGLETDTHTSAPSKQFLLESIFGQTFSVYFPDLVDRLIASYDQYAPLLFQFVLSQPQWVSLPNFPAWLEQAFKKRPETLGMFLESKIFVEHGSMPFTHPGVALIGAQQAKPPDHLLKGVKRALAKYIELASPKDMENLIRQMFYTYPFDYSLLSDELSHLLDSTQFAEALARTPVDPMYERLFLLLENRRPKAVAIYRKALQIQMTYDELLSEQAAYQKARNLMAFRRMEVIKPLFSRAQIAGKCEDIVTRKF